MKKILLAILTIGLLGSSQTFAAEKFKREYGMAGCGLGAVVIGKEGGQIFAGTTNATLWNQMFAITFGTLKCVDAETGDMAARMDKYVAANKLALANDIARGNGETLDALASIMGCTNKTQFGSALQSNYQEIYTDLEAQTMDITDNVITVIVNDKALSNSCNPIHIG